MTHRQRHTRRHDRRRGPIVRSITLGLTVLGLLAALGGLTTVGYVAAVAATAPSLSDLKPIDKGQNSAVYAADGSRLGYVQSDEIRTPVGWKDMPKALRNAVVAIEDENFWRHHGVDYAAIVRAGVRNISSGRTVQGGSTITQQLARALYIKDADRSFERKIREAKLASELEKRRSKRWLLREYLNSVPFGTVNGRTAIGVEAAAQMYFSERAQDLKLHQAALLAGLPRAPSQYNPFQNPSAALERRNEVLGQMVKNGHISRARARRAARRGLGLNRTDRYTKRREPYFFDYVQDQLIERYGAAVFRRGGLKVRTTIDPELQQAGRAAITSALGYPDDPSAAVVSIDPKNGYIKAMASSGQYDERTFNLAAQGHRQPGSAFKTMVLATAVRKRVDPRATTYDSKPLSLNLPKYGRWKVATYDKSYGGRMDLVRATLKSDNTVYAQLDLDLGPRSVRETAELMGITTKLDAVPSEGLGGLRTGVSPSRWRTPTRRSLRAGYATGRRRSSRSSSPTGSRRNWANPSASASSRTGSPTRSRRSSSRTSSAEPAPRRRSAARRGQDRHYRRLQRCVVRGLHAEPRELGLGGLPERAARDARRAWGGRGRGHLSGPDLGELHEHRQGLELQ